MTSEESRTPAVLLWVGRILSGLVIVFLLMDAGMKLVPLQPVIDTMRDLGFESTDALARGLGVLLLVCTALYAFPRTALLGAVLLTGYLGGAIAIHLRVGSPLFTHILFGAYIGLFMWAGLLIRNRHVRSLLIH
ncbi:MAG: DoxX family protein [Fimbriimonadaceae bacterium]|nr:DoxX family protein [Fimbriimonadaceae bacterium]